MEEAEAEEWDEVDNNPMKWWADEDYEMIETDRAGTQEPKSREIMTAASQQKII